MIQPKQPIQIFIAYSRKDIDLLEKLRTHFSPYEQNKKACIWYDGLIEPGATWEADIKRHLHKADIIVLLVSADSIASNYFYNKEMPAALERHRRGKARMIPLILRDCAWQETPFADFQAVPRNGKPVTTWLNQDEAFTDAVKRIGKYIEKVLKNRHHPEEPKPPLPSIPPNNPPNAILQLENDMVYIEGGSFVMGCKDGQRAGECDEREKPARTIGVAAFYLCRYPVTQALWRVVMGGDPPDLFFKGCDSCPVERVSWNDIQEFLKRLNKLTSKKYRLPSEAEWEYAARGGTKSRGFLYSGSNTANDVAWYARNSGNKTQPVGRKTPNELGLHDMSGNVREWCEDDWHDDYRNAPVSSRPWVDSPRGTGRVFRGGSWYLSSKYLRCTYRNWYPPESRHNNLGFRLARD